MVNWLASSVRVSWSPIVFLPETGQFTEHPTLDARGIMNQRFWSEGEEGWWNQDRCSFWSRITDDRYRAWISVAKRFLLREMSRNRWRHMEQTRWCFFNTRARAPILSPLLTSLMYGWRKRLAIENTYHWPPFIYYWSHFSHAILFSTKKRNIFA